MEIELDELKKVIVEVLLCDESELFPETTFMEDLGADSLDIFQMVLRFEEEFDVQVDPDEVEKIKTIADAVELIKRSKANK